MAMQRILANQCGAIHLVNERLRAVVAVDGDVLLGEVAGQHAVLAAAEPERTLSGIFGFFIASETLASS